MKTKTPAPAPKAAKPAKSSMPAKAEAPAKGKGKPDAKKAAADSKPSKR